MSEGDTVYTRNQDGSIKVKVDGVESDYVLKTDLVNVKTASEAARKEYETAIAKHNTDLAEANRVHEDTRQKLLQEQARIEQLTTDTQETATLRTKVGELETTLSTTNQAKTNLEQEFLGMRRTAFGAKYKIDAEKVNAMSLDQLREAEKNFDTVGFNPANPKPANYDGGDGLGGQPPGARTPIEQCSVELDIARKQKAARVTGSNDPDLIP